MSASIRPSGRAAQSEPLPPPGGHGRTGRRRTGGFKFQRGGASDRRDGDPTFELVITSRGSEAPPRWVMPGSEGLVHDPSVSLGVAKAIHIGS